MKNYRILLLSVMAVAFGVYLFFTLDQSNEQELAFTSRSTNLSAGAWEGAAEFNHMIRMNHETGEIDYDEAFKVRKGLSAMQQNKTLSSPLAWKELGPDNFGGRTRALLVDKDNPNIMYAGGVSGGLWRSTDKGNSWNLVPGLDGGEIVCSITQLGNGNIYIGTGSGHDGPSGTGGSGFIGSGLYSSTDGLNFNLVQDFEPSPQHQTNDAWAIIDELAADPNNSTGLWIARRGGIRYYDESTGNLITPAISPSQFANSRCEDVAVSPNGNNVIISVSGRGLVSNDGGSTFAQIQSAEFPSPASVGRIEFAFSPDNSNVVYASVAANNRTLQGIYKSTDAGNSWTNVVPDISEDEIYQLDPFATGPNHAQGIYDNTITVIPGTNSNEYLVGGITLFKGGAGWHEKSCWFCPVFTDNYLHADIHAFTWGPDGTLYIGTDGGVFESSDNGDSYKHISRNYNTVQFYNVAYSNSREVAGGTQDNGTILVRRSGGVTGMEGTPIMGGDGFTTDISYINPSAYIASLYYGQIRRTFDKGAEWVAFSNGGDPFSFMGVWPFRTVGRLWENPNDETALDSILFVNQSPLDTLYAGDSIFVTSPTHSTMLGAILELDTMLPNQDHNCTSWDSLQAAQLGVEPDCKQQYVRNTVQAVYARAGRRGNINENNPNLRGGLQLTRNVFNMTTLNMDWWQIVDYPAGTFPTAVEFSTDGNYLYGVAAGGSSTIYIVSGLNEAYSKEHAHLDEQNGSEYKLTVNSVSVSGFVTDIAVDPNNPDHVIITKGSYGGGGKVMKSTNATSGSPSFTNIWNVPSDLDGMPVYAGCIDVVDPDIYYIGTEFGMWASGDGGASWSEQNEGMHRVPVFEVRQQWRKWEDGVKNHGKVYIGTHGRGFFMTGTPVLSDGNGDELGEKNSFKPHFNVFPNPVQSKGNVEFNLSARSDVEVFVYDLQGRVVHSETLSNMAQGEHLYELNTGSYPSGTYIMIMKTGNRKEHTKFVKM